MLTFGNKYSYLILTLVGFVLGIYTCLLFNGCGASKTSSKLIIEKPADIQHRVAAVEAVYQNRIDSLTAADQSLQISLHATQAALVVSKTKNKTLQQQVYQLLDRTAVASDTTARLADCDSLQAEVRALVDNGVLKDSLQDCATVTLEEEIQNKDSTLQAQRERYQQLQGSFQQTLQQTQALQIENQSLHKAARHQKLGATLKTIGLVLTSILAAHYLIHP